MPIQDSVYTNPDALRARYRSANSPLLNVQEITAEDNALLTAGQNSTVDVLITSIGDNTALNVFDRENPNNPNQEGLGKGEGSGGIGLDEQLQF